MKPTLLFIGGWGWAATSPLVYTLQRLAKYAHGGYDKNLQYLTALEKPFTPYSAIQTRYAYIASDRWEGLNTFEGHKLNLPEDLAPLRGFSKQHIDNLCRLPYSIEKYIDFYKALYEQVQPHGYKAVADFQITCRRDKLPVLQLQEHFNLKLLLIARDPIRRVISAVKSKHSKYPQKNIINNNKISINLDSYFKNYVNVYNTFKQKIPDTHMVVMEELWEGDGSEKTKLEEFLDHPIPQLWPNLYSPDTGHLLKWDLSNTYCPTPCQVPGQSTFELTSSYYHKLREQYKYYYDSWIDEFGSLPLHWGKPIDYTANI